MTIQVKVAEKAYVLMLGENDGAVVYAEFNAEQEDCPGDHYFGFNSSLCLEVVSTTHAKVVLDVNGRVLDTALTVEEIKKIAELGSDTKLHVLNGDPERVSDVMDEIVAQDGIEKVLELFQADSPVEAVVERIEKQLKTKFK